MTAKIHGAIQGVQERMNDFIIGHYPVKEALLLALISQEHLYMQGEPGCAKTLLAEVASDTANLSFHFSQLHRDTRLTELVGDVILEKKELPGGKGEVIRQKLMPGGVLTCEVALLDDICRAPGEALNVLLGILNERKFLDLKIPLMTAIATTNPTEDEYYNEPLDPANLDRFTLQLKTQGAVTSSNWDEARKILDRYEGFPAEMLSEGRVSADALRDAFKAHKKVLLPPVVLSAYRRILDDLRNRFGCDAGNSLLTDRTMLVKVPKLIKAMAFLHGRDTAETEDLRVLKYILTFRVPENVYENLDQIIDQAIEENEQEQSDEEQGEQMQGLQEQEEQAAGSEEQDAEGEGENALIQEILDSLQSETQKTESLKSVQQRANGGDQSSKVTRSAPQQVENLEFLLEKIRGRLERNPAEMEMHPGGSPRSYRRMRSFEDFLDADYVETAIWLDRLNPTLPRSYLRKKKHMGGKVIIVRDVSQSMEGRYARWTSSVVTKLVEMVRRKRMRVGYIEFNHVSHKYQHDGRFFTRDYDKIIDSAANVTCSGVTNYQYPLRDALEEFRKGRSENKHILFLTDGEPTQGDWLVREERRQAKGMGVAIHTLFIGTTECPEILDILSEETDGSRFLATPNDKGGLLIEERHDRGMMDRYLGRPDAGEPRRDDVSSASRNT
ncbi:MAG: AAA family ATPase [SAR324 cluster bacterium]|nr:AAA family ATPase [SAR324 cluster bacterium]